MKLAFCDAETIRLSSDHGSALWECAILLREDGAAADAEYLFQVRPNLEHADAMALRIGGYYERCKVADRPAGSGMVLASPKLPKGKGAARAAHLIALDVAKLLDGALVVGANPWFDAGHIDAFLREHGQALAADYHMRDIASVVAGYMAGQSLTTRNAMFIGAFPPGTEIPAPLTASKLTDVARHLGFNPDSGATHTALGDAKLVRAIWDCVMA